MERLLEKRQGMNECFQKNKPNSYTDTREVVNGDKERLKDIKDGPS